VNTRVHVEATCRSCSARNCHLVHIVPTWPRLLTRDFHVESTYASCSARDWRLNSHEPKMASIPATCVRESISAELASSEDLRGISKALELQHLPIPARTLEKRVLEYSLQMQLASDCMNKFHPNLEYFFQ
jgi:hypothetical protein